MYGHLVIGLQILMTILQITLSGIHRGLKAKVWFHMSIISACKALMLQCAFD